MVNLKEISTTDLFQEIASRKDGRAYLECVVAGLKLQECAKKAKDKAAEGIITAIDNYFNEIKADYEDEMPNYVEGMRSNHEHVACGEDNRVVSAIEKYMELI